MDDKLLEIKNNEIDKLNRKIEKLKTQIREMSINYDTYLSNYYSRFSESIEHYDSVVNQLGYARDYATRIEKDYAQLVSQLRRLRNINLLFEGHYEKHVNMISKEVPYIPVSLKPCIPTKKIDEILDKIISQHHIFDMKERKKEIAKQNEERREFYDLINSKYQEYKKNKIFDFLKENIDDKTANPIKLVLLLAKEHELLINLPTPLQIKKYFKVSESRYKKLGHYDEININASYNEGQVFKKSDIEQMEAKIEKLKSEIDPYAFGW